MEPARRVTRPSPSRHPTRLRPSDTNQAPVEDDGRTAPWHFWLMVAALTIYLGWRLVQGIMWAIGKL
jgi:hypothetical protein